MTTAVFENYAKMDVAELDRELGALIAKSGIKWIALDDDPTGIQTVHDVSVFTDWSEESIREGFLEPGTLFYILTNSRGMTEEETTAVHRAIIAALEKVSRETGKPYQVISRSDSTLRGHYPLETELLREGIECSGGLTRDVSGSVESDASGGVISDADSDASGGVALDADSDCAQVRGRKVDGEILVPYFKEGGRFTIGDVHYVRYGEELIPAAETEFARDVTFGYSHSSIPEYVEEKTGGRFLAEDVICISLEELRAADVDGICAKLMAAKDFQKICVNCIDDCDLKVFCIALYRALASGKTFLYRTAAGFVKVVSGTTDRPLLTREEMVGERRGSAENAQTCDSRKNAAACGGNAGVVRGDAISENHGGMIVVGSHTAKTTAQLEELLKVPGVRAVEFRSSAVLDGDEAFDAEVRRCVELSAEIIRGGETAVCYTERALLALPGDTKEEALLRSVKISGGVQKLVAELSVRPAFVIAKGGITSADVGVKALRVKKAVALGQICPGIPVWRTGDESRFPGIPYVIFPGNVGDNGTLREAAEKLMKA